MPGSAPLYLVIDQGGHASRAWVFDREGQPVGKAPVTIASFRPDPDRVEHDPEALLESIVSATEGAVGTLGGKAREIESIGIATQRASIVCWDRKTGAALSPVISWQDRRTAERIAGYSGHADEIRSLTGLLLSPHYGATKLRWCLDHLPDVQRARAQGRLACGPLSSFILFRLLGERPFVVDPANASRTLLWNYNTRGWEPRLLELFGIPREVLPRCVSSRYDYGHMMVASRPLPVRVVTGDQSAALFAFGSPRSDILYINAGTGGFLQRLCGDKPRTLPGLLSSVAWQTPDNVVYVLEATVNGAGSALHQVAGELGLSGEEVRKVLAQGLTTAGQPPLFLNGVSGLGSPFWVTDFASGFVGAGTPTEKLVAVVESIVFLIRVNLDVMAAGFDHPRRIVISGGLAALDGLCQRLADLSGLPVERPEIEEATAHGLRYLLAGLPVTRMEKVTRKVFESAGNPALAARYKRWLRALEKRGVAAVKF